MSHALIVAVDDGRDPALAFARWVAEEAATRIAHHRARVGDIRRELLRAELADHPEGAAVHGHGRPHAVLDAEGGVLLGAEDLAALDGGWFHAFACYLGEGPLADGARETSLVFAGYAGPVMAYVSPAMLPDAIREALAGLCTALTLALSTHETSREALLGAVITARDRFCEALYSDAARVSPLAIPVLSELANTLRSRLVLTGAALRE